MDRREAIKRTALTLGFAISAPAILGVLKGCKAAPELTYSPQFFTEDQARLISELSEIILPKTSTPGAKDVGVPGFIDDLMKSAFSKEEQEKFIKGLTEFDEDARKSLGDSFIELDHDKQIAFVKKHHDKALASSTNSGPKGWWNVGTAEEKPFILKVKELTILGFFTSKVGASEVLQYNPVPGPYKGCVPLAQVGKAWAT
jgi:gluconate 2-dehydrogenase gamma chain